MTATLSTLSQSKQLKLNELFLSRLRLVLCALALQVFIMIQLMTTFLFVVGVFNIPAILALLACTFQQKLLDRQMQKTAKILLKVGIAKAVGGILLAVYIALKYFCLPNGASASSKAAMKLYVLYLGGSAFVDILYSFLAFMAIRKTREIIKIARRHQRHQHHSRSRKVLAYSMGSSSPEESSSGASTSSEEDNSSEKASQESI